MITAYDYTSAVIANRAGVDMILVGDSLGMVMLGRKDTLSVTLDEMIHHCRAVMQGTDRALVVADMPFMTYEPGPEVALASAPAFCVKAASGPLNWKARRMSFHRFGLW